MDSHYLKTRPNSKFVYDLYGVIVHRGSLNRGHYYSYCKNPHTNKWYLFDDELVREEDDLGRIVDENAYILFYKQKSAWLFDTFWYFLIQYYDISKSVITNDNFISVQFSSKFFISSKTSLHNEIFNKICRVADLKGLQST